MQGDWLVWLIAGMGIGVALAMALLGLVALGDLRQLRRGPRPLPAGEFRRTETTAPPPRERVATPIAVPRPSAPLPAAQVPAHAPMQVAVPVAVVPAPTAAVAPAPEPVEAPAAAVPPAPASRPVPAPVPPRPRRDLKDMSVEAIFAEAFGTTLPEPSPGVTPARDDTKDPPKAV